MATPPKGPADYLALGDYNAACYECGRKFKFSELRRHWQGYYVCPPHFEPRHPQDFVRGVQDVQTVPVSQPENDKFVVFCTPNGKTAISQFAISGCAISGYRSPFFDPTVTG